MNNSNNDNDYQETSDDVGNSNLNDNPGTSTG